MRFRYALVVLVLFPIAALAQSPPASTATTWNFVMAGDSRNCGDVVMPAIAEGAKKDGARFYWHLGDYRAIYTFDEDMMQVSVLAHEKDPKKPILQVQTYLTSAFQDAIDNQLKPFEKKGIPVYAGIGNHETIWPMTRGAFIRVFRSYLDMPSIRAQRIADDPYQFDPPPQTYYHVINDGIDFITLDNGSCDTFDEQQMSWLTALLDRDANNAAIKTVVVGMHAALPDSLSCGHSMSNYPLERGTGRAVYRLLLNMRDQHHKKVYLLASHSHFFMENVYNSDFWQKNGGVLPGWIVGTSGAIRYELPGTIKQGPSAMTGVYGYLLGTVSPDGSIAFKFREITSSDVPPEVKSKYTEKWINEACFAGNRDPRPQQSTCPPMSQCSPGD